MMFETPGVTAHRPFLASLRIRGGYIPPTFPPLLDGLLWGGFLRAMGRAPERDEIPLAFDSHHGVYHGSAMIVPRGLDVVGHTFFRSSIARDADAIPEDVLQEKGSDITKFRKPGKDGKRKGAYKPSQNEYPVLLPHPDVVEDEGELTWNAYFYGVGIIDAVVWLLRNLPGIGRKAARGYGSIEHVSAHSCSQDRSWIHGARPMRPLPPALWRELGGAERTPSYQVIAPPYGLSDDRVACVAPGGYCISDLGGEA